MRLLFLLFLFATLLVYQSKDGISDSDFIDDGPYFPNVEEQPQVYVAENKIDKNLTAASPTEFTPVLIITYGMEICFILLCIAALVVYYFGLNKSVKILEYFSTEFNMWVKKEYNVVDGNHNQLGFFSDHSKSECFIWATGSHKNKGMLLKINTFPRHSVVRWGMLLLSPDHSESLTLTIYFDAKADVRVTTIGKSQFLRADKHVYSLTKISKDFTDLLPPNVDASSDEQLLFFCETKEYAHLVASTLHDILKQFNDAINYLYISDATYDNLDGSLKLENDNLLSKTQDEQTLKLGPMKMELSVNSEMFLSNRKHNISSLCDELVKISNVLTIKHPKTASRKEKLSDFRAAQLAKAQKELHQKKQEESMSRKDQKIREENQRLLQSTDKQDILRLEKNKARREQRKEKKTQRVVMHTAR